MRFKLEDRGRVAARKKFVGVRVVEGKSVEVNLNAAVLPDHAHGVLQNRQRGQPQEIHL